MKRILVTGGAGFVGSALVRRLVEEGHDVIVFDDFSRGRPVRVPIFAGFQLGDIRNENDVLRAAAGCDAVWHLAYVQGTQTFYERPKTVVDVALKGIMNVLSASVIAGVREFFLVSSSETYQIPPEGYTPTDETVPLSVPDVTNPRYSYGGGKIACEIATLAYSDLFDRVSIVRPHNIYGPDMGREHVIPQFAERMLKGGEFRIQGTGEETRSFCHVDDAVEGLLTVQEHGEDRNVYHLGNPEEIRIKDLARKIAKHYDLGHWMAHDPLPNGSPPRRLPDITKLRALGYEPKVMLDDGLPGTLDWYRDHV